MPKKLTDVRITDDEVIEDLVKAKDGAATARAEVKQVKKENRELRKQRDEARDQLDSYLLLSEETKRLEIRPSKGFKADSQEVPIFCWSDWHVEEEVFPESVRDLNEFNLDVADRRIQRLVEKSVEYAHFREKESDIPEAVIWLGGDFFSGYIHEELMAGNTLSPPDAVLWVKQRIKAAITYVAREFPKVRVVCNCGNHSRTTKRRWIHGARRNSFEWLMYHTLRDELTGAVTSSKREWWGEHQPAGALDNVEFFIPDSYFAEVKVFDTKCRFHHGDQLRYGGGVGGPSIPINKAIQKWDVPEMVDVDYFGHLHQFLDHFKWVMNGSLIGYNDFAVAIAATYQPPIQVLDFIHHKRGRTNCEKIYLD